MCLPTSGPRNLFPSPSLPGGTQMAGNAACSTHLEHARSLTSSANRAGGGQQALIPPRASNIVPAAALGTSGLDAHQAAILTTPHPDALRRRQQAEIRRQQRMLALHQQQQHQQLGSSEHAGGVGLPANAVFVADLKGLQRVLAAAQQQEQELSPSTGVGSTSSGTVAAATADGQQLTVVFFSAPWCRACKALYPKFAQIAANNQDVQFAQVSCEDDAVRMWAAEVLGLSKLPYFHLYRGGRLVSAFSASITKLSLLRAEIAAQKPCNDAFCATN